MVDRRRTVFCPIIIGRDDMLELADRRRAEEAGIGRRAEIAAWAAGRPVLHCRPHGDDREK